MQAPSNGSPGAQSAGMPVRRRLIGLAPPAFATLGALCTLVALGGTPDGSTAAALDLATLLLVVLTVVGTALLAVIAHQAATAGASEEATALAARLARVERMLTAFPDAVFALDGQGIVVAANGAADQIFGAPAGGLVGQPVDALFTDCPIERLLAAVTHGKQEAHGTVRRTRLEGHAARRGASFPAEVKVGRMPEHPDLVVCTVRDVSEHRRAEEEMRLYKRAIASSSNGIVISEISLPGQPVLYVNPAFERMTGFELADAFGRNCRFLQGPDSDPGAVEKMRSAIARGAECHVTLRNYTRDGVAFWNHVTLAPVRDRAGQVTHYIGILTDLTEQKHVETVLAERREQLDAIFNLSPDGFAAFDSRHRLTYANPAFLRVTGLEADDVQGATARELDAMLARVADPGQAWKPLDAALLEADAQAAPGSGLLASASRVQDVVVLRTPAQRVLQRSVRKAGGATAYVLYLRDVTRETEVDRMKSEFLSSAAHELRTPLASIYGFTELLMKRDYPEPRRRDMLETIHRQSSHLAELVNELLDLARIEARAGKDFKIVEQPLRPLIESTIASVLVPNDDRKVELALADDLPHVRVDAGKFRQALVNIVSNAYKYSPGGGPIRLSTEARRTRDRDYVGVRVTDHGIGMSADQLAHACERFYRADTSGAIPGTGLGLSLVKEIMQIQGGEIDIASELGRGTTVTLWMPVSRRESRQPAAEPQRTTENVA
jgi:PAS domain S-box-containing protein